jgi:hypothetical protein
MMQHTKGFSAGIEWEVSMKKLNLSMTLMISSVILISADQIFAQDWPGWRGDGRGISPEKNLPLKWSEDEGVKWKTPISGTGHSSPIVWSNRVFVTTAEMAQLRVIGPGS